jgi:hypothetical protein
MERELRALYLRWLAGLPYHQDITAYITEFELSSRSLIRKLGGHAASLGALAGFPVPKTLELSPTAGVIYGEMQQAAISASITAGLNATDAARAMLNAGLDKSFHKLNRLARTETVSAYWKNGWDSVSDLPDIVMVWGAEESKRTCDYCLSRDGLVVEDANIRDHPNGRCTPIPTHRSRVAYKGTLQPDGSIVFDPKWGAPVGHTKPLPAKDKPRSAAPGTPAAPQAPASPVGRDFRNMTNEQRLEAARIMYGTNSPQYKQALARWG